MEHLQELKNWLGGFGGWQDAEVDSTGTQPEDTGLFPMGVQVVSNRGDVLGNVTRRLRQTYVLRRVAPRGESAAAWLANFQQWVLENAHTAPKFGALQTVRAEKGQLQKAAQTGLGIYAVTLTVEFTKEFTYG